MAKFPDMNWLYVPKVFPAYDRGQSSPGYRLLMVTQEDIDAMERKGFAITTDSKHFKKGKAFLDTADNGESGIQGTLYAYQQDLLDKFSIEKPKNVAIAGGEPVCITIPNVFSS